MVHTIKGHTPKIHENVFVAWNAEVTGQVTIAEDGTLGIGEINVNKLVQDTVTGNDTMTLDNINDWTMDNTHIKNGIFATNIGSYTSSTGNNTANGQPYTFVQPSEFDVDSTLRAYVDTLDPGTATEANAGACQFVARAFAAAEEDDEDYKEEFLTRYVKEDKDGNFYTTNTFKAE